MVQRADRSSDSALLAEAVAAISPCISTAAEITGNRSRQACITQLVDGQRRTVIDGPLSTFSTASRTVVEAHVLHGLAQVDMAQAGPDAGVIIILNRLSDEHYRGLLDLLTHQRLAHRQALLIGRDGRCWANLPRHHLQGVAKSYTSRIQRPVSGFRGDRSIAWTKPQQWIGRALLLHPLIKQGWWTWPKKEAPEHLTATAIANGGGIGLSTVSNTIQAFEQRGWIDDAAGRRIELANPFGLYQEMLAFAGVRPAPTIHARILSAPPEPKDLVLWLDDHRPEAAHPWALTGWHALNAHRRAISAGIDGKPVEIVTTQDDLRAWRAIPCSRMDANVTFRIGSAADVLAMHLTTSPLLVTDPILATMHVAADPSNGQEQVNHLQVLLRNAYGHASDNP